MKTLTEFFENPENARRLINLKVFLKKQGVFLEFMNALGEQRKLSLMDLILATEPGEEIAGAFHWIPHYQKWDEIDEKWRDGAKWAQ